MSVLEVEQLLQPVSAESPCGENLEYDQAFIEMNRDAEGKPEQQMGDEIIEAQGPDWASVRGKALDLMTRTKDLRVCVALARAVLGTDGLVGLGDGLAVLRGLIERYWDSFHPQLDPDDWNDPTMRMNVLSALCDQDTVLRNIREATLVESKALGRFSLKDIEIATGQAAAPAGTEPPDLAAIDGAFLDCDLEALQATADAVARSLEHTAAIDASLMANEQVGPTQEPDLAALPEVLEAARQVLAEQLARRGVGVAPGAEDHTGAPQPVAGEVNSREDVIRVLDKACDYFSRQEPSSPVPLLLRRAKRLISKDFMDIIQDIAPDGINQIKTIAGEE